MSRFKCWKKPDFDKEGWTVYGWRCQNPDGLKLGEHVDIGCFTYLNARYGVELGDNVQIGSHCSIYSISTEDNKKGKVTVGENTVIGMHTGVMPGVSIGKNCVIGAFSFVNRDIPDGVVAMGVPCRIRTPPVMKRREYG